jgi:hypothetical protein
MQETRKQTTNGWKLFGSVLLTLLGAIAISPLAAHHGTAASYDQTKWVTVKGVVTEFIWRNPHCALFVDVKDASGKVVNYSIEMFSPNLMVARGYRKTVFKKGDEVSIDVHPARAGTPSGECLGCKFQVNGKDPATTKQ